MFSYNDKHSVKLLLNKVQSEAKSRSKMWSKPNLKHLKVSSFGINEQSIFYHTKNMMINTLKLSLVL